MTQDNPQTHGPQITKPGDEEEIELEALSFGRPTARSGSFSSSSSNSSGNGKVKYDDVKPVSGGHRAGDESEDGPRKSGTLKKSIEARWMVALYWLMFLAGKSSRPGIRPITTI